MFRKNKKNTPEDSRLTSIIVVVFFSAMLVLLMFVKKDILLGNSIDFYDLYDSPEGIKKDAYVDFYVDGVIGNYAETKHTVNFIPVGTDQHYIIWLDDSSFISLKAKDKKVLERLEILSDKTWDYIDSMDENGNASLEWHDGFWVKGVIHTIDPEIKNYFNEGLDYVGAKDGDYDIHYVEIDLTDNLSQSIWELLMMVLFIIMGIVGIIVNNNKIKAAKLRELNSTTYQSYTPQGDFSNDPIDNNFNGGADDYNPYFNQFGMTGDANNQQSKNDDSMNVGF